ncbi:hypothetical protein O3P69_019748 [Scylla paramamosain]|uniref:C2H2-type domain-containing protein n=1 Tax=Scylla paramamosain TaxID=85552 RepID=A0AAW0SXS8_SCYPA
MCSGHGPALTYHTATKHSSVAAFPHRSLLASHSLRHGERRVMCDRCGRKFFTQKQLNCHENLFHRRAQSYTCNKCGTRFSTLRVLRHHIRSLPNHRYYCQECSAAFQLWTQYLTHLLTHGLRCSLCHHSFTTASAAHQHYQTCHSPDTATTAPNCALDRESVHYIRTHSKLHGETDMLTLRDDITLKDDARQGECDEEGSVVIVLSNASEDVGLESLDGCVGEERMSVPVDVDNRMFVIEEEVQQEGLEKGVAAVCVSLAGSC